MWCFFVSCIPFAVISLGVGAMELGVVVAKKLNVTTTNLKAAVQGAELKDVLREGKTLQLHFENDAVLGLHLMLHRDLKLLEAGLQIKH